LSCCSCLGFGLPPLSIWFKSRTDPTAEDNQDPAERLVNDDLSETDKVIMAAANGDRSVSRGSTSIGSAAASSKFNHRVVVNGERNSINGAFINGGSHPEVSSLIISFRSRSIQVTGRYQDEFKRINHDALTATTSMKSFFDFVANDRLRRMPHKGSRWDKILRWAEYFAAQVSLYHESVGRFVPNSGETAQLLWASCRILLQVNYSAGSVDTII
jgi:hypothetical protein